MHIPLSKRKDVNLQVMRSMSKAKRLFSVTVNKNMQVNFLILHNRALTGVVPL